MYNLCEHKATVHFLSPNLLHFPTLYPATSPPLLEGRAGTVWEPLEQQTFLTTPRPPSPYDKGSVSHCTPSPVFLLSLSYIRLRRFNPLNAELNPLCYLLALLAHHFLQVSRIRVKSLTHRLLMSYIYMERLFLMFLDHTQRRTTVGRTPLDE